MHGWLPDMSAEDYHADIHGPSLSASIARLIHSESPLHAWHAHPRLNPDWEPWRTKDHLTIGSIAHQSILEGNFANVRVINADSWQTKAAREQRDEALAAGEMPIKVEDFKAVQAMHVVLRRQFTEQGIKYPFVDGKPEQTAYYEDDGVLCRMRLDWLYDDPEGYVIDYKTTGGSANPDDWCRNHLFGDGLDIQGAAYLRGCRLLGRNPRGFLNIVQETKAPFAVSIVKHGEAIRDIGERKYLRARDRWRECLESGRWPGHAGVWNPEVPPWELMKLERDR